MSDLARWRGSMKIETDEDRFLSRIAELEAALEPFANIVLSPHASDRDYVNCVTVEMCRRAKAVLPQE